jgi:hypothetical protein
MDWLCSLPKEGYCLANDYELRMVKNGTDASTKTNTAARQG